MFNSVETNKPIKPVLGKQFPSKSGLENYKRPKTHQTKVKPLQKSASMGQINEKFIVNEKK